MTETMTSILQPIDQALSMNLKTLCKKEVLKRIIYHIENNLFSVSSSAAADVSAKISVLEAVQFVSEI